MFKHTCFSFVRAQLILSYYLIEEPWEACSLIIWLYIISFARQEKLVMLVTEWTTKWVSEWKTNRVIEELRTWKRKEFLSKYLNMCKYIHWDYKMGLALFVWLDTLYMVHILDGNSGTHVENGNLICLMHLIRLTAVAKYHGCIVWISSPFLLHKTHFIHFL